MLNKVLIYLIIVLISIILYYRTKTEEIKKKYTLKIILIVIFHHFLSNYATFGSLIFGYHKIHLIILLTIGFLWFNSKDYTCPITMYCNKQTGQEDLKIFKDLNYHIVKLFNLNISYILVLLICYDLYFIFKNN